MYIAVTTRLDIAHVTGVLSQFNSCSTEEHWKCAERVLTYQKGTIDYCFVYKRTDNIDDSFVGYVDADWANDEFDRKSYTGYVFKLVDGANSWES
jgi:hypothetical protein